MAQASIDKKRRHAESQQRWLHDPAHPERLEKKRASDRGYYERTREDRLAYQRNYYKKNRERVLARQAKYNDEVREYVAQERLGPCVDCGNIFPSVVMQLHHRNPSEKKFEVPQATNLKAAKSERAKCDLLCANCHCLRHAEDR